MAAGSVRWQHPPDQASASLRGFLWSATPQAFASLPKVLTLQTSRRHRPGIKPAADEGQQTSRQGAGAWLSPWAAASAGVAAATASALVNSYRPRAGSWRRPRCSAVAKSSSVEPAAAEAATPPIWVVNLDKSVNRWEMCKEEFKQHGVVAERFPATLGKAMTTEEWQEKVTFGGRYFCTPGMIGCFMSHLRIWERVVKEGHDAVVVLEDDVVLYPDFSKHLQTLLSELPDDWEVCLLGAVGCVAAEREAFYMKLYGLVTGGGRASPGKTRLISPNVFVPYRPAGTHAYVVSQRGAATLLRMCPRPRYHVDLTAWSLKDLRLYAAKQQLATQRFDDDTTVSKEGAPLTKRFLRWCWDVTGLTFMGKRAGLPNLNWAWTIAVFALPVPFSSTRRRFIIEMGPSSSIFVLICLLCFPLKSLKPLGFGLAYMSSIIFMIRWLAGTQKATTAAVLTLLSGAALLYG